MGKLNINNSRVQDILLLNQNIKDAYGDTYDDEYHDSYDDEYHDSYSDGALILNSRVLDIMAAHELNQKTTDAYSDRHWDSYSDGLYRDTYRDEYSDYHDSMYHDEYRDGFVSEKKKVLK